MLESSLQDTQLLTVQDAAKWLGVGVTSVYKLMKKGELPYVAILADRRIAPSAIEALIAEHRIAPRSARSKKGKK